MKKLKEMKLGETITAGGHATLRGGRRVYDSKGEQPGEKDIQRIRDMKKKAGDDMGKLKQLAFNMAKAITDKDKAVRRAAAADQILKGKEADIVAETFLARADEL